MAQSREQSYPPFSENENSPYGVLEFFAWNHDWNNYHYPDHSKIRRAIALMKEAGIDWVRMDFLWNDIEPAPGQFDFERYDFLVDELHKNGIHILGIVGYSANWAGSSWNALPDEFSTFSHYAATVAARYKNWVRHWEIWNEPDHPEYLQPQDNLKGYTELLKVTYPAIKSANPQAQVLLGGLTMDIVQAFKNVYANGGGNFFDIVSIHPFAAPLSISDPEDRIRSTVAQCRDWMQKEGKVKPIWITEIGCPGVSPVQETADWWLGKNPSLEQQADYVQRIYGEIFPTLDGVEKIFWAFFRNADNFWHNGIDHFGLITKDFTPKPAYSTYKKITKTKKVIKN